MILYLDTSSLVKLYVEEDESPQIETLVRSSEVSATSIVAYAEARAAFARRFREGSFTSDEHSRIKTFFDKDWPNYFILNIMEDMVRLAGNLAEKHALRGFDSIHLASALILHQEVSSPLRKQPYKKAWYHNPLAN
ncbi:MAG: type II toxin-antitoxin system VapC family toxin [Deltaproteobacteria bacterium]|nr:type II toxin-antitoxin system VapC family toxin [Deltaproteobacteria bacterium]